MRTLFLLCAIFSGHVSLASSLSFEEVSQNFQQYICYKLGENLETSQIVLAKRMLPHFAVPNGKEKHDVLWTLGLDKFFLLQNFTEEKQKDFPIYIYDESFPPGQINFDRFGNLFVFEDGKKKFINKNCQWKYLPPYQPSFRTQSPDSVFLFLLHPFHTVDKKHLRASRSPNKDNMRKIIFQDAQNLSSENFIRKYQIEPIFSNAVFKLSHSCIFRINSPFSAPQANAETCLDSRHSKMITLSQREFSEIVYLQTKLNGGNYALLVENTSPCLLPVKEVETKLGKMLELEILKDKRQK